VSGYTAGSKGVTTHIAAAGGYVRDKDTNVRMLCTMYNYESLVKRERKK